MAKFQGLSPFVIASFDHLNALAMIDIVLR